MCWGGGNRGTSFRSTVTTAYLPMAPLHPRVSAPISCYGEEKGEHVVREKGEVGGVMRVQCEGKESSKKVQQRRGEETISPPLCLLHHNRTISGSDHCCELHSDRNHTGWGSNTSVLSELGACP